MADRSNKHRRDQGEPRSVRNGQRSDRNEPESPDESDEFITDAEMEAREANSSPQDEDPRRFSESD